MVNLIGIQQTLQLSPVVAKEARRHTTKVSEAAHSYKGKVEKATARATDKAVGVTGVSAETPYYEVAKRDRRRRRGRRESDRKGFRRRAGDGFRLRRGGDKVIPRRGSDKRRPQRRATDRRWWITREIAGTGKMRRTNDNRFRGQARSLYEEGKRKDISITDGSGKHLVDVVL